MKISLGFHGISYDFRLDLFSGIQVGLTCHGDLVGFNMFFFGMRKPAGPEPVLIKARFC